MNLFIGNLNPETRSEGLRELFSEFGEVLTSKVIFDIPTGTSRGFGFVEMADKNAATDAIDNLDMSYFEGNIISVKEAKQSNQKSSSPGGRPQRPGGGGAGGFKQRSSNPRPGGYNSFNRSY
ncbi:MAG: RNA-binding protein [Chitinophagia bacterium]|nr:RNA-binding protein [Chitinophagia bacterium]